MREASGTRPKTRPCACTELATLNVTNAAAGYAEIGEIRRRIGDLDGAEDAFRHAEQLSGQPQAGLALLRLAQGNVDAAVAIITARSTRSPGTVSAGPGCCRPAPRSRSRADDLPGAVAALEELDSIVSDFASPALIAATLSTRGRLSAGVA